MPLSGRLFQPLRRSAEALGHAQTILIKVRQVVLRDRIALLGCAAVPLCGLAVILWHALAVGIQGTQTVLRASMVLCGCLAEPLRSHGGVLRHALAVDIHLAQLVLRLGITALGRLQRAGCGRNTRTRDRQRAILQAAELKLRARRGGSGIAQKIHATFRTGLR